MALSARLNLRQSQTMTMTPQLLQSIRLLQLTHLELQKFIEDHVERNPLLTQDEALASIREQAKQATSEVAQQADQDIAVTILEGQMDSANSATPLHNEFPDDRTDGGGLATSKKSSSGANDGSLAQGGDTEIAAIEDMAAKPLTLRDHVAGQIAALGFSSDAAPI
ncbi:MAG: RNA polymerase sigma-54 factor, partial [Pseudomonadota bacterium]